MKSPLISRRSLIGAALATPLIAACGSNGSATAPSSLSSSASGTLTIWDYETDESAMGKGWAKAIEIFQQKFPNVTVKKQPQVFEQIQKNAKIVLAGDSVPDVMEYNKGNATAGVLASQELITPITDVAKQRGWDKLITGALQTTATYSDAGLMGSGDWYGIPNYGEYVTVYYNKDLFTKYGVTVPTTLDEFEKTLSAFQSKGVTPLATAAAEYPTMQIWYELVLSHADRAWVDSYQLFKTDLDWHDSQLTAGTNQLTEWIQKGYIAKNSTALKAEDMGVSFINGKFPMMISGSWWFGRLATEIKFDWGQFLFPGNTLNCGSSGNLWVVPDKAKNKDLAYEFIDITLSDDVQNIIGQNGGLPVAGDPSTITDEKVRTFTEQFSALVKDDGLAFYPDWPVAGFYDNLVSAMQSLTNGAKSTSQVLDFLKGYYESGKKDILGS